MYFLEIQHILPQNCKTHADKSEENLLHLVRIIKMATKNHMTGTCSAPYKEKNWHDSDDLSSLCFKILFNGSKSILNVLISTYL